MQAPTLPLPVRLMNAAGGAVRAIGFPLGELDVDRLIAGAKADTGLDDFGDDEIEGSGIRTRLGRLVDSLESEGRLTAMGRFITAGELRRYLADRLQVVDWHRREPSIGEQEIRRPVFIVGQARSGTTILHELLALDPANRVPQTWETDSPCPPPERATYETDPRIAATQAQLDRSEQLIPDFKRMHRMGAQLPQECVRMTGSAFSSMIFAAQWRVPSYISWLIDDADMAPVYRYHRRFLQLLQWRCPPDRWIVKSPGHLWCLDAVVGEYPDACFIQTHRDPIKILSSLTSLELTLRTMTSDAGTAHEVAAEWSRWLEAAYERSVDFRERGGVDPSNVVDVQFRAFMKDPVSQIAAIYDRFGWEFTSEAETRMRDYVDGNPSDRDGKHEHRFADTGLDLGEERAKVKRYQEYFGVESEERV